MFSRNYRKWMGERSQSFINLKAKIILLKGLLPALMNLYPYNYVSLWASRNRSN